MSTRPAAHLVSSEYLAKYQKATELMKALPADDPRNFTQQANVHCAYCNGGYNQVDFPKIDYQVHFSWLFFPFHRMYLYFYEKILGSLIKDPNFALPFWNWDHPNGMYLPQIFNDVNSLLYDKYRNCQHLPPTLMDLDYSGNDPTTTTEEQIASNLTIMHKQMVSSAGSPKLFYGDPYVAGDEDTTKGAGTIENIPHNSVHRWTGTKKGICGITDDPPYGEDMGILYSASRDPIFYAHHANVDRMWTIWKNLEAKKKRSTGDALENKKLGYQYQDVEIPWLQSRPTPLRKKPTKGAARKAPLVTLSQTLDSKIAVELKREKNSRSKAEKEDQVEILVIEGVEFESTEYVKFDVYVNDEDESGPGKTEFAGSFVRVPHKGGDKKMTSKFQIGITELLEDIGADDDDDLVVVLVPRTGTVTVNGPIRIEFDSCKD
ncbi:hypothetical protein L6164_032816 [Bauhinia variegata]|uniref:Uncharacterized protein n=1 Tax=Bauhinia variegata TaxID=167791 RepID=A0ACB9KPZ2_BAUVA|nr:hypothetical protein L6164_032816 [Bauhinia variegata]